jgi:AbrB family looped-hinge helix DNA binding protein
MERLYRARVNDEGRLVIPAECRKYLGIAGGQEVILQMDDHGLHLFTQELALKQLQDKVAAVATPGNALVSELIQERQQEADRSA